MAAPPLARPALHCTPACSQRAWLAGQLVLALQGCAAGARACCPEAPSAGLTAHRLPSLPSMPVPALSAWSSGAGPVPLAGAHSSTMLVPSTKHSPGALCELSGTQSSSSESLRAGGRVRVHPSPQTQAREGVGGGSGSVLCGSCACGAWRERSP